MFEIKEKLKIKLLDFMARSWRRFNNRIYDLEISFWNCNLDSNTAWIIQMVSFQCYCSIFLKNQKVKHDRLPLLFPRSAPFESLSSSPPCNIVKGRIVKTILSLVFDDKSFKRVRSFFCDGFGTSTYEQDLISEIFWILYLKIYLF